ncbi:MAG TPA: cytochrome c biogenesis protein CcsA [Gemmatimonadaceae bacterium]|nr:cytochrome c biogenesis protein CcsA [Gemmatimonadaceae bacterium]
MVLLGELSLWIALLMAIWCAVVSLAGGIGGRRELVISGERAAVATLAFTALAAAGLWTGLLTRDFSLAYVASRISANVPDVYAFTAFWGGPEGSMLLWALILALYTALTVWTSRAANRGLMPFVTGTLGVLLALFLGTTALAANPFARLDSIPLDGAGMLPLLQNPGMATHPPALYLGLIATAIPFAFALGALATRRIDVEWLSVARRWTLVSWLFLTIGIVLGMWWAYVEPGSVTVWARDPVANLSLLPWLTATAFLVAVFRQERRGVLRTWSLALPVATFVLTIVGAAVARGGIIGNAHGFARSPVAGVFSAFLVVTIAIGAWLLATRLGHVRAHAWQPGMAAERRRHGGYVALAGMVVFLAALAGSGFRREYDVSVTAGQHVEATDPYGGVWRFVNQGISKGRSLNRQVTSVTLEATRNGRPMGLITSEHRQYFDSHEHPVHEPSSEAGIRSGPGQDVHVTLAAAGDDSADLRITFIPLMMWVWIGGGMLALGGLMMAWPRAEGVDA